MGTSTFIPGALLAGMALGGLLGYQSGARQTERLQGQLATLHRTLDDEARSYQDTQQDLQRIAESAAQARRESQARLAADAQARQGRLLSANAEATQRIARLQEQLVAFDRERGELLQDPAPRGADALAIRQAGVDRLEQGRQAALAQIGGLACLAVVVPDEQLAALRD